MTSATPAPPTEQGLMVVPHARLYWEATGAPDGVPVLYLHGGPGSGLGAGGYRHWHDPARFRTIGLDQRGCGRSTPTAQDAPALLRHNTTATLVADLEALRVHLGIQQWIVTGISWGSTLALAYALEHPTRVLGVALLAVTTTSRAEVDWITDGVGSRYPAAWERFAAAAEARPGERPVAAYARRLAGGDPAEAARAARDWDRWEAQHGAGDAPAPATLLADPRTRLTFALLVTHYWSHDGFLTGDRALLPRLGALAGIPGHLIHGGRDVSSPDTTARQVHRAWPGSTLTIIAQEGHVGPRGLAALQAAVASIAVGPAGSIAAGPEGSARP